MKKLNSVQMENLQGGLCIIDEPGYQGCAKRCEASIIAFLASGGNYPGPICIA